MQIGLEAKSPAMIVYINGAFGVGKTTVADLLVARLPNAILFDPELVGDVLTRSLGELDPKDDFQHYDSWSELVGAFLRSFRNAYPHSTIVVPMSLLSDPIRNRTIAAMREADTDVRSFTLVATPAELERRIRRRDSSDRSREWCLQHMAGASVANGDDAIVVNTTALEPKAVVDWIVDAIAAT